MKHVLPVCGCQRPLLCCGVLGRQHKEEGCGATRQAGEEGWSCCGHQTGLPHSVAERRTLSRLLTILDNVHHPLHSTLNRQKSIFSGRLLSLSCSSDRLRRSFVPWAIQLLQRHAEGEGEGDGLLCMSLPQSPLLFSALYFSIPLSIFLSFYSFYWLY